MKSLLGKAGAAQAQQAEAWLRQNDWGALTGPLAEVRLPKNWALLEQQPVWSQLVGQAEWSYRDAVALCAWVRSAQPQSAKAAAHRKTLEEAARAARVERMELAKRAERMELAERAEWAKRSAWAAWTKREAWAKRIANAFTIAIAIGALYKIIGFLIGCK